MAWAGLRDALITKDTLWISSGKDNFDIVDQLFDYLVALELLLDDNKPMGQQ